MCISYDVPSRETERTKSSLLLCPQPVEGLVAWFLGCNSRKKVLTK